MTTSDEVLRELSFLDDAPEETSKPKAQKKSSGPRRSDLQELEEALTQLFILPAMAFQIRGDEWCAGHILTNADKPARAWAKLAGQNEKVYNLLKAITTGGAWGEAMITTAGFVLPMLAHHGRIPKEIGEAFGVGEIPDYEQPPGEPIVEPVG